MPPQKSLSLGRRLVIWTRRLVTALFMLTGLSFIAAALVVRSYEADLPKATELSDYEPVQVTRVLAADGTVLGEEFLERRTTVPLSEVPEHVRYAVLAAEDAHFYEHTGLNYLGMLRAMAVNLRENESRQGGSTITQQLVKNVLLTPERTYARKVREVILARRIEQELTKDEILELYLNQIYFGHGRYGIEEASRYYFGKGVAEVDLAEAALMAGLPKGPSRYSPRVHLQRALTRRTYVLDQMAEKGFASATQVEAAKQAPVHLAAPTATESTLAPEVVEEVRRRLREIVGPRATRGGYVVTTTIRPDLQRAARGALTDNLDAFAARKKLLPPFRVKRSAKKPPRFEGKPRLDGHRIYAGVVTGHDDEHHHLQMRVGILQGVVDLQGERRYNPKGLAPTAFADVGAVLRVSVSRPPEPADGDKGPRPALLKLELAPQGALVAIDHQTREIVALVGSYEAVQGGLDRASFAHRQPGSTFKAFVYGYAIQSRALTAASRVETDPGLIEGYKPANYDAREDGEALRLRPAIAKSVNVAAVWTLQLVGAQSVASFAQAMGIESKLGTDPSLALGAYEVTPRELANAYASFASGGVFQPAVLIKSIHDPNGRSVELPPAPARRRAMSEAEAFMMTNLLQSVVKEGTGRGARILKRPIAGKTGTSNEARDAWFAGYSTDFTCVVWTGYDDGKPLGRGETGSRAALPAFVSFMKSAHEGLPARDFVRPKGIIEVTIDPKTGLLAHPDQEETIRELFLADTEPTEVADPNAIDDEGVGGRGGEGVGGHGSEGESESESESESVGVGGHGSEGAHSPEPGLEEGPEEDPAAGKEPPSVATVPPPDEPPPF